MTETIKRNANGSIDTNYYMQLGRQARSNEAYRIASTTRAVTRTKLAQLREAVEEIINVPTHAKV